MPHNLNDLKTHHQNQNKQAFNQVLTHFLPRLKTYIAARLRYAEFSGLIPQRMYFPSDIADEIYLEVFENFNQLDLDPEQLKIHLFKLADQHLEKILKEEAQWQDRKISLHEIVREELETLEESFYPEEVFDEIEYQQEAYRSKLFLLEEGFEEDLLDFLELEQRTIQDVKNRQLLAQAYQSLPPMSRIILELKINGGLSEEEIADIRKMKIDEVEAILEAVKKRFRNALSSQT